MRTVCIINNGTDDDNDGGGGGDGGNGNDDTNVSWKSQPQLSFVFPWIKALIIFANYSLNTYQSYKRISSNVLR